MVARCRRRPPAMNSPTANSRVSPGRNGKSSPHSMNTMTRLIQKNSASELVEQPVRVHPGDAEQQRRWIPDEHRHGFTLPGRPDAAWRIGLGSTGTVRAVDELDRRAPYDPMPHGPAEVGVGPVGRARWPTGEQYDARLLAEGDRRNVVDRYRYWTHGGDRRRPRHPAARLPRGDRELAARLQHRHDRALRQRVPGRARCTSSATGAGTGAARWSPTATSTCGTTPTVDGPRGVPARAPSGR